MKQTTKTSRTAGYLERIFRAINQDSFGGEIEEPIITIMSTKGAYGHVTVGKVWKQKDEIRHELNICSDWLSRPIENVVATMIHEMVHLYNIQNGVQDCSRGGTYHNKKFKEEAEKHMLSISKDDKYGWTITSPTDELLEYILLQGWDDIQMERGLYGGFSAPGGDKGKNGGESKPTTTTIKPKGSNSRKHTCPCCGAIARTTKDIKLICGACMVEMEVQ